MSSLIIDSKIEIEKWLDDFISSSSEYFDNYDDLVEDIIANVKENGDEALISLTHKFDNVQLEKATLFFSEQEIRSSSKKILAKEKEALNLAASRIKKYHIKQLPKNKFWKDEKGVNLGFRWTPINSIGIYVPGGLASYPSSVLMNAIPAKVAGVRNITMVTPTPLGKINPLVLYAAKIAGVDKIVKIGGAQAIAALAYGTESIDAVDKIVGPGNSFVAAAKRKVFGQVGIDSVAGPSEVLIIADSDQNPSWIAADLLAQAEHDEKAKSILITDNITFAKAVELEVWKLLSNLKDNTVASKSWSENGKILVVNQLKDSINLANTIAAEHLQICIKEPEILLDKIVNAGAIFLGENTPEVFGDYILGSNHVLPTCRAARFSSPLSTIDFMKRTSISKIPLGALKDLGYAAKILATSETLDAHAFSASLRISEKNG
ncbi:MAG: histidinol dehydrogenase [Rhodobacterales bacterium]|jgi:histidinol dehydrogenase|nr:MAG: histidinol dehydrogenase [Rhodobacterales bacterium]|tara:strand:- start:265 stop:1566 length:1302 start_codon:yes stop_codon:yes gene_type:complete